MTCTTHHHACECREAEFQKLSAEVARLRAALFEWIETRAGFDGDYAWFRTKKAAELSNDALSSTSNPLDVIRDAQAALDFGVNVMMRDIHSQRTMWPAEVDDFEDKAKDALTRLNETFGEAK